MSSSHTISEEMIYVKGLGEYCGVMAYAAYLKASMLEGSLGAKHKSLPELLAELLPKAIRSSPYLYKIMSSAKPLPLPETVYGREIRRGLSSSENKNLLSIGARILDDYVACSTMAWHTLQKTLHQKTFQLDEDKLYSRYYIKSLKEHFAKNGFKIVYADDEPQTSRLFSYTMRLKDMKVEVRGKPDLIVFHLSENMLRSIVLELTQMRGVNLYKYLFKAGIKRSRQKPTYVFTRTILYMATVGKEYGLPPIGIVMTLNPDVKEPFAYILSKENINLNHRKILDFFQEILSLKKFGSPPPPQHKICSCTNCRYSECPYSDVR